MRDVAMFVIPAALVLLTGCTKDEGTTTSSGVDINFRTDSGYTYANDTVPQGDTVFVCAVISQGADELQWFYLSISYDSTAAIGQDTVEVNTDPFVYARTHVTRTQPGTEQLIFTVEEADGDLTSRRLTFFVP